MLTVPDDRSTIMANIEGGCTASPLSLEIQERPVPFVNQGPRARNTRLPSSTLPSRLASLSQPQKFLVVDHRGEEESFSRVFKF